MNMLAHHDIGEETIDLLQRLIALASVNDLTPDSGNEEAAADRTSPRAYYFGCHFARQ